jgi:hypothetical protein
VCVLLDHRHISLAILNWKTQKDADVGANGPNYGGIDHIGFQVFDLEAACRKLEDVEGKPLTRKEVREARRASASHRHFET